MKNESTGKKSLLWLWITIGVVVLLAIAGVVAYFVFFGNNGGTGSEQTAPTEKKVESDLYWNIDRKEMIEVTSGLSMREPAEDGIYYIRFAVGGEVVELPCADKKLVNRIDLEDLVCLEFDADGIIINMIDPEELYTKIAEKVYVQNISGNKLLLNTSQALNGMQINLEVPSTVGFDVSALASTPGESRELEGMDQVTIYGTDEETATHVFVVDRWWESDVYWRVSYPMTANGASTRQKAEDGYWYMDWAVNGEVVTLRTNRQDVINAWEGYPVTAACCGHVFDENGDAIDCFSAAWAVRGTVKAAQWDVVELSEDGKTFTIERLLAGDDQGETFTATIGEDCGVYNVSSTADVIGEVTELQLNDRLHLLCDSMGNPKVVYVMNRMVDVPLAYNLNCMWSDGLGRTQRTPDKEGWYNFEIMINGKVSTYRTKDVAMANKVDSYTLQLFGMESRNGIITKVYDAVCVCGNYSWCDKYFVNDLQGPVVSAVSPWGYGATGVMAADCLIYDVSNQGAVFGQKTTLRLGDRILAYQNVAGEITHIYVVDRYQAGSAMYLNVNHKALLNGATQRVPDEEGYYVFNVIKIGSTEVTQIKTKDAKIAANIDKQAYPYFFAAHVNKDGIVTGAYPAQASVATGGYSYLPGISVQRVINAEDQTWLMGYATGATAEVKVTDDIPIYNFSGIYREKKGERTKLQIGDTIYCYRNNEGAITHIFVMGREAKGANVLILHWVPSTEPDADGYYSMYLSVDGTYKLCKTKDKAVFDYVKAQTTLPFAGYEKDGILKSAFALKQTEEVKGGAGGSFYDVAKISGGKLTLRRNRPGQADTGKEVVLDLASNYKVYNMSSYSTAEEGWGKADKMQLGDRVQAYVNNDGKVCLVAIVYENARNDDGFAVCPHCGEKVWWERADSGSSYIKEDGHYYVARSSTISSTVYFGDPADGHDIHMVLDMNGKTVQVKKVGAYYVTAGNLILDDLSEGKTGKFVGTEGGTFTGNFAAIGVGEGGPSLTIEYANMDFSMMNNTYTGANQGVIVAGSKLTINDGNFIGYKQASGSGNVVGGWSLSNITINGGNFVGGNSTNGGVLATTGLLNIKGGNFSGGIAKSQGGLIYAGGKTYITGGEFIGTGDPEKPMATNGGLIYSHGMDVFIDNVELTTGSATAYGKNIYYRNDDAGVLTIGKNAVIGGYLTARSHSNSKLLKVVARDGAIIDYKLSPVDDGFYYNLRVQNAQFFIDTKDSTPVAEHQRTGTAEENVNFSLGYNCQGKLATVVPGVTSDAVHNRGEDYVCQDCGDGTFTEWTNATALPTEDGNYKLMVDVETTEEFGNINAIIDLNGHNITRTVAVGQDTNQCLWEVGAGKSLTIIDTTSGMPGTLKTVHEAGQTHKTTEGVVFFVNKNATLTIKAGVIDASEVDSTTAVGYNTGAIVVGEGTLTLDGSRVTVKGVKSALSSGGTLGGHGGSNIVIKGEPEIYGGNINGYGGIIATNGNVTIEGGTFYQGTAAKANGIYISNAASVLTVSGGTFDGGFEIVNCKSATFSGDVKIDGLATAKPINMSGLTADAKIKIEGAAATVTSKFANADSAQKLIDDEILFTEVAGMELKVDGNAIKFVDPNTYVPETDVAPEDLVWTDWTEDASLPTTGNYRLTKDVNLTSGHVLEGNLNLDLNGYNINLHLGATTTAGYTICITNSDKLYVTDLSGKEVPGKISLTHDASVLTGLSCVVYATKGSTFTLDNGIIDGSAVKVSYAGAKYGAVTVGNGNIESNEVFGTFIMNGGTILGQRNPSASSYSAASAIGGMGSTTIVINGGTVQAAASTGDTDYVVKNGGAIATNGTLTITGGEIIGTRVSEQAGTILVEGANGKLTMTGGTVKGGTAATNGGNILILSGASANITGGRILGGWASGSGYNIDFAAGDTAPASYIGGDVVIEGGVGIRSGKLVLKDRAIINGMLDAHKAYDIKMIAGASIYVGDADTVAYTATSAAKVRLSYDKGFVVNGVVFVADATAAIAQDWTDATSLPTSGYWTLQTDVTVDAVVELTGVLAIDLNGRNITRTVNTTTNQHVFHVLNSNATGISLTLVNHNTEKQSKVTVDYSDNAGYGTGYTSMIYSSAGAGVNLKNVELDGSSVVRTATGNYGVILVGDDSKLYIQNAHLKGARQTKSGGSAICTWGRNFIIIDGDNTIVEGGVGSGVYGGVIQTNGKYLEINGGTFRAYEGQTNLPASGGLIFFWADASRAYEMHCVINGGTFYGVKSSGSASVLNADNANSLTINGGTFYAAAAGTGAMIYTNTNSLTINGGEFYGMGSAAAAAGVNHGGIIFAGGQSVTINGGYFTNGACKDDAGYGPNFYYNNSKGAGVMTIGPKAVLNGGVTVRGKADATPTKIIVSNGAQINKDNTPDDVTAVPAYNLQVRFAELYLKGADVPSASEAAGTLTNFDLAYTNGVLTGIEQAQ